MIYFAIAAFVLHIIWTRTTIGKNMFAIGGNTEAAEVSGVNISRSILYVYLISGVLYGIASYLEAARVGSVTTQMGTLLFSARVLKKVLGTAICRRPAPPRGIADLHRFLIGLFRPVPRLNVIRPK